MNVDVNTLPDITTLPALSVDIGTLDKLFSSHTTTLATLNSSFAFDQLQQQANEYIKSIFPTFDLTKIPSIVTPQLKNSYAFNLPSTRPIESLPKNLDEFRSVFPNFPSQPETQIVPSVSSLQAKRPLHEETKKELTPLEKMLDENFKQMHATIQQALSAARSARIQFDEKLLTGPIHPYQKLVHQYLGPDFKTPSVYDLPLPVNFCPVTSLQKLNDITDSIFKNTVTQFQHLTAGIGKIENDEERTMLEGLGHGFAVLSATSEGPKFVIDKEKTAKYIEFAETFRSIPIKEIVNNPVEIAQRVIARIIEIFEPTQVYQETVLPDQDKSSDNLSNKDISLIEEQQISLQSIVSEEQAKSI